MSLIYENDYQPSIAQLVQRFARLRGCKVEAWLFADRASRRQAETQLAGAGVKAHFRSAYKPLLHFFLEELDCRAISAAQISYPCHHAAVGNRFLLETYPLTALFPQIAFSFAPSGLEDFSYRLSLTGKDGVMRDETVFAPNRLHKDFVGETMLSPTGWLCVTGAGESEHARFETDYEKLYHDAITAVECHNWGDREPYFDELTISVSLPIADRPLTYGFEALSLTEALHEDIYFSLLEIFQKKSGRPLGDRGLQPGQIVPEVRYAEGPLRLRIETRALSTHDSVRDEQVLHGAIAPLSADQVQRELARLGGTAFTAQSRSGRMVHARYVKGSDRPIMISAGQHANETTGGVGALRAATQLAARPGGHFTVSPLENPDGYALHRRLCAVNPRHMHHAARYTALGDDLEYRSGRDLYETSIRLQAERLTGAKLHVNLHGYPAHEWTRPMTGYVPRNFALWTLPKGFFLILRHHADWQILGQQLLDRVTRHLAAIPGLVEFNNAQIRLFEQHAGETGFRIINGFPCLIGVDDRHRVPLTLITEYPDETIYGDAFIKGHGVQMETVIAAYDAIQALLPAVPMA